MFLHSNEKEGKIIENINFEYLSNRTSFMGNSVPPKNIEFKFGVSPYWDLAQISGRGEDIVSSIIRRATNITSIFN